jgi:lysophospholipase L1-like esterase
VQVRRPRLALLLAGASVLAALAVAELAARLVPRRAPLLLQPFIDIVENRHGTDFDLVFESDPELFWRLKSGLTLPDDARPFFGLISNAQGLREDHEVPLAKPPGEVRILFLGDSVTFGYLVRHEETFVRGVERELRTRVAGARVACINAGVPGYSLFQGLRFLETRGFALAPDLVVLEFGWNDQAHWPGGNDAERHAAARSARPPAWLAWSRLAELVAPDGEPKAPEEDRARVSPVEFRALLEEARAATRARGIDLLLLVGAGRFNLNPEMDEKSRNGYQIQQYLVARDTPFGPDGGPAMVDGVSAARALLGELSSEAILFDGVHPTPAGHRAYAAAIVERVQPWLAARAAR